jgi:hypothetical protein
MSPPEIVSNPGSVCAVIWISVDSDSVSTESTGRDSPLGERDCCTLSLESELLLSIGISSS